MEPRTRSTCPTRDEDPNFTIVVDWLAANGIDEYLPDHPYVEADHVRGQIIYRAFQFATGERGYDASLIKSRHWDLLIEDRAMPLIVPVDKKVRDAFQELENSGGPRRITLIEVHDRMVWSTGYNTPSVHAEREPSAK